MGGSDPELAAAAKAEAILAFGKKDYETAAQLFKRAAALGGEAPETLHCNRAACLSNLGQHEAALEATEAAIKAQPAYVKAYYRQALALYGLRRWEAAQYACDQAKKLNKAEGGTEAVAKQLEALSAKAEEEAKKTAVPECATVDGQIVGKEEKPKKRTPADSRPALWDRPMYAEDKRVSHPPRQVEYMRGAVVRDVSDPGEEPEQQQQQPTSAVTVPSILECAAELLPALPAVPQKSEAEKRAAADAAAAALAEEMAVRKERARADEKAREATERSRRKALDEALKEEAAAAREQLQARRAQQKEEALAASAQTVATRAAVAERLAKEVGGVDDGASGRKVAAGAAAAQARANVEAWRLKHAMPTRAPLVEPRTPSEFTRQYALLRKDAEGLYAYLKLLPAERLPAIFSPEVPNDVLVAIAVAITQHVTDEDAAGGWAVTWLGALTKVGRFDMTVLMLDKPAKAAVSTMFDSLVSKGAAEKAIASLRKSYL